MTSRHQFEDVLRSLQEIGVEIVEDGAQSSENIQGSYARARKILGCVEREGLPTPNQAWVENSWTVLSWGNEGRALFIDNESPHYVSTQFIEDGSDWLSCLDNKEDVDRMLSCVRRWVNDTISDMV